MRVMQTLYVADHRARVRIRRGNVVVERSDEATRVPVETLEAIVLTGRAEVSNHALGELTRRGVRVSALSKTGRLRFHIAGATSGNVMLRIAQVRHADAEEESLRIARWIVAGKLQNCRRMMRRWAWDAPSPTERGVIEHEIEAVDARLAALAATSDGDTVRGIEGDGSRRYFKAMAMRLNSGEQSLSFPRRSRRPPRDPVNALLGFVYGLVLTEVIGASESVGLDPQIGFLHRPRPGRPSLALDLIEELRPSVADRFAVAALQRGQVRPDDFEVRAGHAVYLNDDGRRKVLALYDTYRQQAVAHPLLDREVPRALLPSIQATLMARHLRGDLSSYPPLHDRGVRWTSSSRTTSRPSPATENVGWPELPRCVSDTAYGRSTRCSNVAWTRSCSNGLPPSSPRRSIPARIRCTSTSWGRLSTPLAGRSAAQASTGTGGGCSDTRTPGDP